MEQITVVVRGRFNSRHWSCCVLSVSPQHGVLSLSESRHPENWSHRPLRVTRVQLWPCFGRHHLRDSFSSPAARLTLRVYGDVVRFGNCDVQRDGRIIQELGFTADGCHGTKRTWMVRFPSYSSLEKAIALISQFAPDACSTDPVECGTALLSLTVKDRNVVAQWGSGQSAAAKAGCESFRGARFEQMMSDNLLSTATTTAAAFYTSSVIEGDVLALLAQIHAKCEEDARLKLTMNTTESTISK